MNPILLATTFAALSTCQLVSDKPQKPDETSCQASGYESMIGKPVAAITLPASLNHRIIGPDTMVTYDYIEDRVNFYTDKNGVIERVECG